ncbi:hypothetical protein POPTR_010G170801v4 [Populus trichocarpa]|uniref:Uncharacterized protein n=2 Tax=Populus trichocarpa TaxID=3694 RepID=A0ACC0SE17_POPTR|nr:hypothetical protein POPTR_010G170801v4 [Populus trichocarpa]KAI9387450.1 hypothetical protein POPTR_010G170801v4 [Populus trichocarpa]
MQVTVSKSPAILERLHKKFAFHLGGERPSEEWDSFWIRAAFKLFPCEDKPLLIRWDPFLVPDLGLDIIRAFDPQHYKNRQNE